MKNNKLAGLLWVLGAICFLFLACGSLSKKNYTASIIYAVVCLLYIINAVVNLIKKRNP